MVKSEEKSEVTNKENTQDDYDMKENSDVAMNENPYVVVNENPKGESKKEISIVREKENLVVDSVKENPTVNKEDHVDNAKII